jgi:hypothetical protein
LNNEAFCTGAGCAAAAASSGFSSGTLDIGAGVLGSTVDTAGCSGVGARRISSYATDGSGFGWMSL